MLLAQIISSASVTICMLVDSIMIGQFLGVHAIAAYGIASPLLFTYTAFGSLLSTGIQVVVSRSLTKNDKKTTNTCYTGAIVLSLIVGFTGLIAVYVFTDPISCWLGAQKGTPVFDMTKQYLRGFMFGAPAFIISQILVPFLLLSNNRGRLVTAVVIMTLSDILMDVINVKIVHAEMFGMGAASALSYYFALAVAFGYLISKSCIYKFNIHLFSFRSCLDTLKNGIPTAVNSICYALSVYCINQILLSSGHSTGVAIYSVLSTFGSLCFAAGGGIGTVSLALGGVFYSEDDRHSLHSLVKIFIKWDILIGVIETVFFLATARPVMGLFLSAEPEDIMRRGTFALRIFVLCLMPSALNSTFKNYYLGIERVRLSELISLLQNFLFLTASAFVLNLIGGMRGIWFAFLVGEILTFITICVIVWIHNRKIVFSAPAFAMLDADFGVCDEDMMDIPIESMDQVRKASEDASKFCLDHGGSKSDASKIALVIDEMGSNIIQHGFSDGKEHNMQLRVIAKKDEWIVGFRDDCKGFDPVKYRKKHDLDNSYTRLGLKLVFEAASDVKYVNALGLNNLTIRI